MRPADYRRNEKTIGDISSIELGGLDEKRPHSATYIRFYDKQLSVVKVDRSES